MNSIKRCTYLCILLLFVIIINVLSLAHGADPMTITQDGKIGIGTTIPSYIITVESSGSINTISPLMLLRWTDSASSVAEGGFVANENNNYMGGLEIFGSNSYLPQGWNSACILTAAHNNLGKIIFRTKTSGTYFNRMVVSNDGNVGIGTTSPSELLHIQSSGYPSLLVKTTATTGNSAAQVAFGTTNNNEAGVIQYNAPSDSSPNMMFLRNQYGDLMLSTGVGGTASERLRIDSSGNVGIATTSQFGGGAKVLGLGKAQTAPTTNPSDAVVLYVEDLDDGDGSATAELMVRDEDGNVTNLSSHKARLFTPRNSDPAPFTHYSSNAFIGRAVNADLSGALKDLECLTG